MIEIPWYGLILITAVLIALTNIIKKHLLDNEHALEQMVAESPFRLLVLLFLIPFVEFPGLKEFGLIIAASLLLFFTILYRNKSYRHLPISTVSPLMNLSPIFLLIIATTLLGEELTLIQLLGIGLVMSGGYLLDLKSKSLLAPLKHAASHTYTPTIVVTLILLSMMGSTDKFILQELKVPVVTYLFWLYLSYIAITLIVHTSQYGFEEITQDLSEGKGWLFLTGTITVIQILIMYYALSLPGVLISLVVPLRRTATLIETFVGGSIYHEENLLQKTIASVIMVLGVLFIV